MDNIKLTSEDLWLGLLVLVALSVVIILGTAEAQLDAQDMASHADRLRIYCASPGHIEGFCREAGTSHGQ